MAILTFRSLAHFKIIGWEQFIHVVKRLKTVPKDVWNYNDEDKHVHYGELIFK